MREIKFRAWDKTNRKYYKDCNWLAFILEGIRFMWVHPESDKLLVTTLVEYELMQYTGLKDKNGKEIYEGDIVLFKMTGFGVSSKRVIEWEGNGYGTMIEDYHREVIGNIYENPGLLKGEIDANHT